MIKKNLFMRFCLLLIVKSSFALTNYYVDPTRIVLQDTTNSAQLLLHNKASESQPIQTKVLMLMQELKNGTLTEINPPIMGQPQVVVTPQITVIPPKSVRPVRILAMSQLPNDEIAYRLFVRSITPRSANSTGTIMELGFGIPLYILPKNIINKVDYNVTRLNNGNYELTITNKGNVHVNVNKVVLFDNNKNPIVAIETPGIILSGKYRTYNFKLAKIYQSYSVFNAEMKTQDTINYNNEITTAQKIEVKINK